MAVLSTATASSTANNLVSWNIQQAVLSTAAASSTANSLVSWNIQQAVWSTATASPAADFVLQIIGREVADFESQGQIGAESMAVPRCPEICARPEHPRDIELCE